MTTARAARCECGCEYFVWRIREQGRYSSETPWEYYDWQRHPRAVCRDCNRDVPRVGADGEARKETP